MEIERCCERGSRAYVAALSNPHVIELLLPLYRSVPRPAHIAIYAVSLAPATASHGLQLVFPELSCPGNMVVEDVTCTHAQEQSPCRLLELLRDLMRLSDLCLIRMTAKYVVVRADESEWIATLQLSLALHERAAASGVESDLWAFEFALSHLQTGLMTARSEHDGSRSPETLATARQSLCHVVGCSFHGADADSTSRPRMQLQEVFHQLMSVDRQDERSITPAARPPKRVRGIEDAEPVMHVRDLPRPVLHHWVRMLNAADVAALSGVCSLFRHVAYEVVPGLKLELYSHQRKALRWLLHREGSSRRLKHVPHPFVFPTLAHADAKAAIDLIDGRLVPSTSVTWAADTRGGLFCDEPGLGKTITMLALILRTKGQRSDVRDLRDEQPSARTTRVSPRFAAYGREIETRSLLPSAATLIIVPRPLLDHWRFQIATHTDLPSAEKLTKYDIVITSFERLSEHWKFHKPKSASEKNRPDRYGFEDAPDVFIDGFVNRGTSALLRIHWVRIVVDEGHMLGGRRTSNHMCMAELLHASKRWVMTGTPTPTMHKADDLRHLHGLLAFLRERPYGHADAKAWTKAIARPFEANERHGYVRLLRLLQRIMLRHTKASILKQIPTPKRFVVFVDPTPKEFAVYNGVIAGIRNNLVVNRTLDGALVSANSLLHMTNRFHALNAVRNLRDSTCCGGGSVHVVLRKQDMDETVHMLRAHGVSTDRIDAVQAFLQSAAGQDVLCLCPLCDRKLPVLMLVPCGHFVCADCIEDRLDPLECGVFKIEDERWTYGGGELFAKAQKRQKKVPGAKKPKPKKREFVAIDYAKFSAFSTGKTFYVARRVEELLDAYDEAEARDERPPIPKIIVFSQLRERIYKAKIALAQHGIPSEIFVGGITAVERTAALVAFRSDPERNVLLLSDAGSHGLDLSFVTHIFLMEEVLDASLEQQVVARAHRMGARHAVVVEKLLMRGSIDEYLHASRKNRRDPDPSESEGFRRQMLRNLRAIDETHMAAFGFLRFQVVDERGGVVRQDNVRLPNPGDPPPATSPLQLTTTTKKRGCIQPSNQSLKSFLSHREARADENQPPNHAVRIKLEPNVSEAPPKQPEQHRAAPVVIDLTSDLDDSSDDDIVEIYSDSETDDEWNGL